MEGETVSKMPQELSVQTPTLSDKAVWLQTRHLASVSPSVQWAYYLPCLLPCLALKEKSRGKKYSERTKEPQNIVLLLFKRSPTNVGIFSIASLPWACFCAPVSYPDEYLWWWGTYQLMTVFNASHCFTFIYNFQKKNCIEPKSA